MSKKVSWKDVLVELKTSGTAAVAALSPSRSVLRASLRKLQEKGDEEGLALLEGWCRAAHGFGLQNRGTRAPRAGETRNYRIQSYAGGLFVKIPLSTCEGEHVKAGGQFPVRFTEDGFLGGVHAA